MIGVDLQLYFLIGIITHAFVAIFVLVISWAAINKVWPVFAYILIAAIYEFLKII